MNFLAPWAFAFAALAPVIVLLYLLKVRRRVVTVSTVIFWQQVLEESRRRALFQRLRNFLSLLLHLLIFACILLALAKPVLDRVVRAGSSIVVVIDTRARMQAIEPDGKSRFEVALVAARSLARQAGGEREVAILTAGASPEVAAPFSSDSDWLAQVAAKLSPTDASGDLTPALALADSLLASRSGDRRICLISDSEPSGWKPTAAGVTFESRPVGSPRPNVGITRFAARSLPASPETSEVLLEARNFGREDFSGNVEISLDGNLLDVRPLQMPSGGKSVITFPMISSGDPRSAGPGLLTAHLQATDALPLDNTAYAVRPTLTPRNVLLVSEGNWFLEKLLAADSRIKFELLKPDGFRPAMAEHFDVLLLDKVVPAGVDLTHLPTNTLFIRDTPFGKDPEHLQRPPVTDTDDRSPVLYLVNARNLAIDKANGFTPPGDIDDWHFSAPIRSFDHPLLITGERKVNEVTHRMAALTFDPLDSDLPLRVSFPLLMGNLVQWLASGSAPAPLSIRAGETLTLQQNQSLSASPITTAVPAAIPASLGTSVTGGTAQPLRNGFYRLMDGPAPSWIAVNTFSQNESDLNKPVDGANTAHSESSGNLPRFLLRASSWPLWRYLAATAFLLLCCEWALFHQRRTE